MAGLDGFTADKPIWSARLVKTVTWVEDSKEYNDIGLKTLKGREPLLVSHGLRHFPVISFLDQSGRWQPTLDKETIEATMDLVHILSL